MVRSSSHKVRCQWIPLDNELYQDYHDHEWGVPIHDDQKLFEFLILEGAQAGLSWITVLKRREAYREAFAHFDPAVVALFNEKQAQQILQNAPIIKNRLKVASAINNAKQFLKVQDEFGSFDRYVWQFVNDAPLQNHRKSLSEVPAETPESIRLSKDLKKRGFNFVGPTLMYAFMQAAGMVNDHTTDCFRHSQLC